MARVRAATLALAGVVLLALVLAATIRRIRVMEVRVSLSFAQTRDALGLSPPVATATTATTAVTAPEAPAALPPPAPLLLSDAMAPLTPSEVDAVGAVLRTGDVVLALDEGGEPVRVSKFLPMPHRLRRAMQFAFMWHGAFIWRHPSLGACVVEGVRGTRFRGRGTPEDALADMVCPRDAYTGEYARRGLRVVPWARWVACLQGRAWVRRLHRSVEVYEEGVAAMVDTLSTVQFAAGFRRRIHTLTWRFLLGTNAPHDQLGWDGVGSGFICSEAVGALLAAGGVWSHKRAWRVVEMEDIVRFAEMRAAHVLRANAARAAVPSTDAVRTLLRHDELSPRDFSSFSGVAWARAFWGPELRVK